MAASGASWPFRPKRAEADARRLVEAVSQVARRPALFGAGRAPDSLDGRLEMIMLHGVLALIRLNREPDLAPLAQAYVDRLFRHVDDGLREAAVGDTAVPKRMRKIAGDFYGRLSAYGEALEQGGDLSAALGRNVFGDETAPFAAGLAAYAARAAAALAAAPAAAMFEAANWPSAQT